MRCAAPPTGLVYIAIKILLKNPSSTLSPNLFFNADPISGSYKSSFTSYA
jgi:hypothetical protein